MDYRIYWTVALMICTTLCVASSAMVGGKLIQKDCPGLGGCVGAPQFWPPRSSDLNPLDFYFWGELKQSVYSRQVLNIDDRDHKLSTPVL
ncbi:hypothetical protein NQ318_006174 [Aromia moschata]|uniref:Uncharacterized protein n=1 Tax=Aromia moschata TaxID=1265417 RepID=A0AAV8XSD1_9CUCU|nr:hypothetical protein NQ318_006174 [Aromia moschata]